MKSELTNPWQIWVDTGGTFTDCIALAPSGEICRAKVLSSSALRGSVVAQLDVRRFRIDEKWNVPDNFIRGFEFKLLGKTHPKMVVKKYDPGKKIIQLNKESRTNVTPGGAFEVCSPDEAPILAARIVTATPPEKSLPEINMRLASTRGTNALLERKGAAIALFITTGFGDLLRIGNQQRPDLFALEIVKPEPLYEAVVEVNERLASDGSILRPIDLQALDAEIVRLLSKGIRVAAVALMHSYRNPVHEQDLADFLINRGFQHVSSSAELAPLIKIVPRAETAVVDAYLAPVIENYFQRVHSALEKERLHVMTSAGGLVQAGDFHAKDSLLSGPAGGVVGAALAGKRSGIEKVIAFDMGGTSTDVARYDGDFEYVFEQQVGDAHLVGPALAIESVAAGGGSICHFDGYRLRVGPESASAQPGPACYGAGGPLTLTDVNLLLGRLEKKRFDIPISTEQAQKKFAALKNEIKIKTGEKPDSEDLLQGFLDIANERMADAIRKVSIRKGVDPQEYALLAFGGAGGQHACGVAEWLAIKTIIIPKDASLLSATGLGHAVLERFSQKQILEKLPDIESKIPEMIREIAGNAHQAVMAEGMAGDQILIRRRIVNLRFVGQDSVLAIDYEDGIPLQEAFDTKYREIFGHLPEGRDIECESIRVVCSTIPTHRATEGIATDSFEAIPDGTIKAYLSGEWKKVPFYERLSLRPGARVLGPALVFEQHSATVVKGNWQAEVDRASALILRSE